MPLLNGEEFPFTNTGPESKELWPIILEKAYAKKYGSYENIEGGLVDFALAEMTNGIPESMDRKDNQNLEKWWNHVYELYKEGNVHLGAGSPSHQDGDRATSDMGIVQGHAFSILKMVEVDGLKLLCIRNPHGRGEWKGDWSDDSELWNNRMKNVTGQKEFLEDGIFWMDFNDFVEEFDTIYICRVYNEDSGWFGTLTHGKWEGQYAEGVPTRENPQAKLEKNPNYSLTVSEPGKGFLVMRLKEKETPHKAKQAGLMVMQANQGQLVSSLRKGGGVKQIVLLQPAAYVVRSSELTFPTDLRYPYTFSFVVANMKHGEEGHGHYSIQVFTKCSDMKVEQMN